MAEQNVPEKTANNETFCKKKGTAAILCFLLGSLGIHRFYLGHVVSGIALLILNIVGWATMGIFIGFLFLGICGLWEIIDLIRILSGSLRAKDGNALI